jgi:hypothetical protein
MTELEDEVVAYLTDFAKPHAKDTEDSLFPLRRAVRLLLAERMALREVLMPFAHRGENPNAVLHDDDFRRARSVLQGQPD